MWNPGGAGIFWFWISKAWVGFYVLQSWWGVRGMIKDCLIIWPGQSTGVNVCEKPVESLYLFGRKHLFFCYVTVSLPVQSGYCYCHSNQGICCPHFWEEIWSFFYLPVHFFWFTHGSHETHATPRPVIGELCFHSWEEMKSDSRQMPGIVSSIICFL